VAEFPEGRSKALRTFVLEFGELLNFQLLHIVPLRFSTTTCRIYAVGKVIIRSLKTNSGYLERAPVVFHPGLNCIIGARGTCKTTIVESLRFVLDDDVERRGIAKDGQIIPATLRAGTVRCELEADLGKDPQAFIIEREVGTDPRIFEDGVKQYDSHDILRCAEILSQGDLQDIATDSNQELRLSLIDRPHRAQIDKLKLERQKFLAELSRVGLSLRSVRSEIEQRKAEIKDLDRLRSELQQSRAGRPELTDELAKQHGLYQERQNFLEQLDSTAEIRNRALRALEPVLDLSNRFTPVKENILRSGDPKVEIAKKAVETLDKAINDVLVAQEIITGADPSSVRAELAKAFDKANQPYFALRQEQQILNEALKREEAYRKQIEHLEKSERRVQELAQEESRLLDQRRSARLSADSACDQLYRFRAAEVDAINESHSTTILLTLNQGTLAPEYLTFLSGLLSGSRLKTQDNLAKDLATQFSPSELIDHVEAGDARPIAQILNRDIGQVTRVLAHLRDHPDLYNLELHYFEDALDITFYDDGTPKPVESLSKGQTATALLPLILRASDQPLIFDQPEDDLDNSFIYRSLVKVVRELKKTRQLIFVTHNANIPVLGDADRIIVMRMTDPTIAAPPLTGSVDDCKEYILTLLEGGKEAFELRRTKYAELLGSI
jgi:predicted ATP-dependent endonuclease of OLD family